MTIIKRRKEKSDEHITPRKGSFVSEQLCSTKIFHHSKIYISFYRSFHVRTFHANLFRVDSKRRSILTYAKSMVFKGQANALARVCTEHKWRVQLLCGEQTRFIIRRHKTYCCLAGVNLCVP